MGVNLIALANNHIGDFGPVGVTEMLELIERRQLTYAGAGRDLTAAAAPAFLDTRHGRVALVAASSSGARTMLASLATDGVTARPGLSPLRFSTEYLLHQADYDLIRGLDDKLGTSAARLHRDGLGIHGFGERPGGHVRALGGLTISPTDEAPRVRTVAEPPDVARITAGIAQAKAQAPVVAASIHCHEGWADGWNTDVPADFVVAVAHALADAGASIVLGHGPHMLRGVEIYNGVPIFYSLGNFFFQLHGVTRIPAELYEPFGLDPRTAVPADLHSIRAQDASGRPRGFYADHRYWQACIAACKFRAGRAERVEVVPIELGLADSEDRRGLPRLPSPDRARTIIAELAELSSCFDTRIAYNAASGRGVVTSAP
jgi:poly-gamma-glutamate synthesis protein (capsule biosynthesis protein)